MSKWKANEERVEVRVEGEGEGEERVEVRVEGEERVEVRVEVRVEGEVSHLSTAIEQ